MLKEMEIMEILLLLRKVILKLQIKCMKLLSEEI